MLQKDIWCFFKFPCGDVLFAYLFAMLWSSGSLGAFIYHYSLNKNSNIYCGMAYTLHISKRYALFQMMLGLCETDRLP